MSEQLKTSAVEQFHTARFQANLEIIRANLTGRSADLLSYEDVRKKVRARETNLRELKEIPLDAIVGSVGRYKDFTRQFLPRTPKDQDRWARVHGLTDGSLGLPPIEAYQIGDVYFVSDGNHRVSVARSLGSTLIEAYVTRLETEVPLTADVEPNDLILKERYASFLERTRLKEAFPDLDLSMSLAGNYSVLDEQIGTHQWWIKEYEGRELTYPQAAARWYNDIYWPVIEIIRRRGMMCDFPQRTETDLYVWIDRHRQDLAEELGWSVDVETAVTDLVETKSKRPQRVLNRLSAKVSSALTPAALEAAPEPGIWRESMLAGGQGKQLFPRILVAVNGREDGWLALEQALHVARFEHGRIYGLHVAGNAQEENSAEVKALKTEFDRRCQVAGIPGELRVEVGQVTNTICDRARWTDLVVVSLAFPPGPSTVSRLGSKFRQLLRRSPRPVLAIPRRWANIDKLLLAYDGGPKAGEALYIAAYLAGQWGLPLVVVTVLEKEVTEEVAAQARSYLAEQGIDAAFVLGEGSSAKVILETAEKEEAGLIIMGGYGQSPLVEAVLGSTVNKVLRSHYGPILICG